MIALLAALALAGRTTCSLPPGWKQIEARHTRYVVFGEMHGTTQSPDLVGSIACALAKRRQRVLVGLELSAEGNKALQAAWAGPHATFAATIDQRMIDWHGRRDGVASEAMHALLVRLHALKNAGASIDVVAFNPFSVPEQFKDLPGQGPHEAGQAANIRAAAAAKPYDKIIVLVGNIHALKRPVTRGSTTWKPMAMWLPDTTTLDMEYAGGSMWNCRPQPGAVFVPGKPVPDDAIACRDYPVSRSTDDARQIGSRVRAGINQTPDKRDYDGYYWLGPVTSSPPYQAPVVP